MDGQPRDHIVQVPDWFITLRYVQIGLAAVVFALSAFGLSAIAAFGGASYAVFVAIATFIICTWYIVSVIKSPSLYNGIAVLVLECFQLVWWLSAWTNLASWAAAYTYVDNNCYGDDNCYKKRGITQTSWESYRNAIAAGAAIGAVNFVLFKITLIVFAMRFRRHRIGGHPWSFHGHWANGAANGSGAGGAAKRTVETIPMQAQQGYQQPSGAQQGYASQPVYGQQPVGVPEYKG